MRRTEVAPRPQPLVPAARVNRVVLAIVLCLAAGVVTLFFQVHGFLGQMETRRADAAADARLRAIDHQMDSLRGRFNGLLAESVETRLRLLQRSVDTGQISAEDLKVFAELQKDLALLETYAGKGVPVPVSASLEHGRYQPVAAAAGPRMVGNDELLSEVQAIKTLFYFCLIVLAVGVVAFLLFSWSRHQRIPTLEAPVEAHPQIEPPAE